MRVRKHRYAHGGMITVKSEDGEVLRYKIDTDEKSIEVDEATKQYLSDIALVTDRNFRKIKDTYIFWYDDMSDSDIVELEDVFQTSLTTFSDGGETEMFNTLTKIESDFKSFKPDVPFLPFYQIPSYQINVDKQNSIVTAEFYDESGVEKKSGSGEAHKYIFSVPYTLGKTGVFVSPQLPFTILKESYLQELKNQFKDWASNFNWYTNVQLGFNYVDMEGGRIYKFSINLISIPKIEPKKPEPKEEQSWTITYSTENDNTDKVWVYGRNEDEAIENAKDDYWDIKEIISVQKNMADGGEISNELSLYVKLYYKAQLDSDTAASNDDYAASIRIDEKVDDYRKKATNLIDAYNKKNNTNLSLYKDFYRDGTLKEEISIKKDEAETDDRALDLEYIEDSFNLKYIDEYGNKIRFKDKNDGSILVINNYNNLGAWDAVVKHFDENFKYGGKMADGGELENDTFVMLFEAYGFVEQRGSYGTRKFYNLEHNAQIYYDPKYRSISGYVGGGEGNDEVIPYSVDGVLDFFIEHDITESESTPFAKGGKVKKKRAKFQDKVDSISERLEGTKVPQRLRKDYGARYDSDEANLAARRIAGAQLRDYKKMVNGGMISLSKYYKTLPNKELLVGLKVYDKINDEYIYIKDVDSGIWASKNKNDELGHYYKMSDLMIEDYADGGMMTNGGKVLDLKDVYYDLSNRVGRLQINDETDDYISCDIRDWGNWEHDYEDYERDEEDFEDDDSMILSDSSAKRMQDIVEQVRAKYPSASIKWGTSEKNYIDFNISRKMAAGGNVWDKDLNVYTLVSSKEYFGSDTASDKRRWFRRNGRGLSRDEAKRMAQGYIDRYGKENVYIGNVRHYR